MFCQRHHGMWRNGSSTGYTCMPSQTNRLLAAPLSSRFLATLVYSLQQFILDNPRVEKNTGRGFVVSEMKKFHWILAIKKKLAEIPSREMCAQGRYLFCWCLRAGLGGRTALILKLERRCLVVNRLLVQVPVEQESGRSAEPIWTLKHKRKISCLAGESNLSCPAHSVVTLSHPHPRI